MAGLRVVQALEVSEADSGLLLSEEERQLEALLQSRRDDEQLLFSELQYVSESCANT